MIAPDVAKKPFGHLRRRTGTSWRHHVADVGRRERVVDGQSQAGDWPARHWHFRRGPHRPGQRPQRLDVRVVDNPELVVENEDTGKARRVRPPGRAREYDREEDR